MENLTKQRAFKPAVMFGKHTTHGHQKKLLIKNYFSVQITRPHLPPQQILPVILLTPAILRILFLTGLYRLNKLMVLAAGGAHGRWKIRDLFIQDLML